MEFIVSNQSQSQPELCPECKTLMDCSYEDGGGDDGDSVDEVFECPQCGYEIRHVVGSSAYHDGYSYIFFDDDDESPLDQVPDDDLYNGFGNPPIENDDFFGFN